MIPGLHFCALGSPDIKAWKFLNIEFRVEFGGGETRLQFSAREAGGLYSRCKGIVKKKISNFGIRIANCRAKGEAQRGKFRISDFGKRIYGRRAKSKGQPTAVNRE
jgi:hypothetical protein